MSTQATAFPDVNAETNPFDRVQHWLDQTANFSLYAIPDRFHSERATVAPANPHDWFGLNGGYGIDLKSALHSFDSPIELSGDRPAQPRWSVGEEAGVFRARCMFGGDDLKWSPATEPAPAIYDPWRQRRFSLLDAHLDFFGDHRMEVYGVGRTFPANIDGESRVYAAAVGNITRGSGRFRGREGTFVMTGRFTPQLGFQGQLTCRVLDPQGEIRSERESFPTSASRGPDDPDSYLVMRGEKKDRTVRTVYGPPPGPDLVSLITPSQMRSARYTLKRSFESGPRTASSYGSVVAAMDADVSFNLFAPPGTADKPVPFTTQEVYRFQNSRNEEVATVNVGIVEGIAFGLKFPAAPEQGGVRFAGFGPITGGSGLFQDARGMLTVNSLIGIAPHALSLIHVLHLVR